MKKIGVIFEVAAANGNFNVPLNDQNMQVINKSKPRHASFPKSMTWYLLLSKPTS